MMQNNGHGSALALTRQALGTDKKSKQTQGPYKIGMSELYLRLLGEVQARRGTVNMIELPGRKATALLGFLALSTGGSESREKAADLLWGDHFEEQAKQNLRQCLTRLRKALGEPAVIVGSSGRLGLEDGLVQTDVALFEHLASQTDEESLDKAVGLYSGELMEGLEVNTPPFHEWLTVERVRLVDLYQNVLERLAKTRQEQGDFAGAILCWRKSLLVDPLRESAYRALMRLFVQTRRRTAAIKEFQACEETLRRELSTEPELETVTLYREIIAGEALATPAQEPEAPVTPAPANEPVIAILPFDNLSGDPAQDYVADGVTEDITTELSRFHAIQVIARNSSFQYKGVARDVRVIGRELGVDYMLEGSIRRDAERLRVTAQLIDAVSADHIWAERYDRNAADLFDVQEDITGNIVGSIAPEIALAEIKRAARTNRGTLHAYDVAMHAMAMLREARLTLDKTQYEQALVEAEHATELDPGCAEAWATLAFGYAVRAFARLSDSPERDIAQARLGAEKLRVLDARDHRAYLWLGWANHIARNRDEAIADLNHAQELNPNCTLTLSILGAAEAVGGLPDEARTHIRLALRRSPRDPMLPFMHAALAFADFASQDFESGVHWARQAIQVHPYAPANHLILAACLVRVGENEKAREAMDVQRTISNDLLTHHLQRSTCPYWLTEDADRYISALNRANQSDVKLSVIE